MIKKSFILYSLVPITILTFIFYNTLIAGFSKLSYYDNKNMNNIIDFKDVSFSTNNLYNQVNNVKFSLKEGEKLLNALNQYKFSSKSKEEMLDLFSFLDEDEEV